MALKSLFPTFIFEKTLNVDRLRRELLREAKILQEIDAEGIYWSKENYVGGYTSYSSQTQLHHTSPTFGELAKHITKHAQVFAQHLGQPQSPLELTDMWVNIMPPGAHHSSHIHPQSVISGTFYVQVPKGGAPLVLEDPRLPFLMTAPARITHHKISTKNNTLILFESWLRHEVPTQNVKGERISVSFNLA